MNGLRKALGAAAVVAFALTGPAYAHDGPHAPEEISGHTAAGLLSATNTDGPKTASHLRIGIWNSASNVTVYHTGASRNDWVLYLLYDKLLEPSPYLSRGRSWLATEVVPVTPDNRVWEAEIRHGVKWHDGTNLTAEDVVFTYEYYRAGPTNRWTHHVSQTPRIDTIELVSPTRVRFTSAYPMPNVDLVTVPEMPIFQKKQWPAAPPGATSPATPTVAPRPVMH